MFILFRPLHSLLLAYLCILPDALIKLHELSESVEMSLISILFVFLGLTEP